MLCSRDICSEEQQPYARLGYTEGEDTSVTIFTPWGSNTLDLEPIVKKGETDTVLSLNCDTKQIDYQAEKHEDHICLNDMWALMSLEDHGNTSKDLTDGDVYIYRDGQWVSYPLESIIRELRAKDEVLDSAMNDLQQNMIQLTQEVNNLRNQVQNLSNRLGDVEGAIYNWANDKTTKIPRGNINVFSGGMGSNNYIRSRDGNPNNDLNFS